MLTDKQIVDFTAGLFLQQSERDKQKKVGASNISNPCTRHLAHDLVGTPQGESKYWMGARIGTAIHSYLEKAIELTDDPLLDSAIVEKKITLGEIEGYGTISSKPDLVLPNHKHLIDWKSSLRAKVKKLRNLNDGLSSDEGSIYTVKRYVGQGQLYAWGLNKMGIEIEAITMLFINRDGTNETDIWPYTFEYDESIALALWARLENLWAELQDGVHPDSYLADPNCFSCILN
nr:MAG TPA: Exonuclease [Caudoviricetes sp.]